MRKLFTKIISLLLCVTLIVGLTGCSKSGTPAETPSASASAPVSSASAESAKPVEEIKADPVSTDVTPVQESTPAVSEPGEQPVTQPGVKPEEQPTEAETPGTKLLADYKKLAAENEDLLTIAQLLGTQDVCGYECQVDEFQAGYMPGFSADVTGFNKCVGIVPWIMGIPFCCYIFECDDPEAFKTQLLAIADPRWNICTMAEETVCEVVGNRVFITMEPGEDHYDEDMAGDDLWGEW